MIAKKYHTTTRCPRTYKLERTYTRVHVNWSVYVRRLDRHGQTADIYYPTADPSTLTQARAALKWAAQYNSEEYKIEVELDVFAMISDDNFNYSRDYQWASDFSEVLDLESVVAKFPRLEKRLRKESASLDRLAKKLGIN
tara:strand:- start:512 stop:931 length:420 start_codon:yes stop_codon:yes gene_type:complete